MHTHVLSIGCITLLYDKRICFIVYFKIQLTKTNRKQYMHPHLLKTLTNHKSKLPDDCSGSQNLEHKFKHPLAHSSVTVDICTKYDDPNKRIYYTWNEMNDGFFFFSNMQVFPHLRRRNCILK